MRRIQLRMPSFRERYCSRHHCTAGQFERRVFWACLYPQARALARLILLFNYDFFSADRALIACAGDVTSLRRLREEIHDFGRCSDNRRWLRRSAHIRISGRRLQRLGHDYLPENATTCALPERSAASVVRPAESSHQ